MERCAGGRGRAAGLSRRWRAGALEPLADLAAEVRDAGPEIVRLKGATEYAIALCVRRICEAVLKDERAVLSVSTLLSGQYGIDDVYLGTPCVVGRGGVERVIELDLAPDELEGIGASAATLQEARRSLAR